VLAGSRRAQLEETQDDRRLVRGGGYFSMAISERDAAIKNYRRVVALKGDYVEQARKGLAALQAK
jgi:hypothetical protein